MDRRRPLLAAALALAGCTPDPAPSETDAASSGGLSSSSGAPDPTTGGATSDMPPGTGTEGQVASTSTGDDPTTTSTSTGPVASTGPDDTTDGTTGAPALPAPDWMLQDVNPESATHDQPVSPRDYLEKVSGWYFTHAT